jgi:hypothetical protein
MALAAASTLLLSSASATSRTRSRVAPVAGALPSAGRAAGACALFAPPFRASFSRREPRAAHRARLPPPRSNELNKWCAAALAGGAPQRVARNLPLDATAARSHQDGGDGEGEEYEDDYSEGFDKETMALFTKTLTARVRPLLRFARSAHAEASLRCAAPRLVVRQGRGLGPHGLHARGRRAATRPARAPQRAF